MKSTDVEVNKRILEVYTMLCKGFSYSEIIRYCSENYKITSRQADKYIQKSTEKILEENKKTQEQLRAEATLRYLKWMRKAEEQGNYRDAGYLQSRLDKINGLETLNINENIKSEPINININFKNKESLKKDKDIEING